MGEGEKKRINTEVAEVGAQRTLRREPQEHRPFGFAQGKQECLCHTLRCDTIQGSVVERNLN